MTARCLPRFLHTTAVNVLIELLGTGTVCWREGEPNNAGFIAFRMCVGKQGA